MAFQRSIFIALKGIASADTSGAVLKLESSLVSLVNRLEYKTVNSCNYEQLPQKCRHFGPAVPALREEKNNVGKADL